VRRPHSPVAPRTTAQSATSAHIVRLGSAARWILCCSPLLLTVLTSGCADTGDIRGAERNDATDVVVLGTETQIFGGAPDDDRQAVGSVVALKVGKGGSFELCSAALIAPNVALTARHCVAKSITTTVSCDENGNSTNGAHIAGDQDPANVAVYVGASPNFNEGADAVGRAIVAPESDHLCDSDIAIVVLDRALENVEPLAVRLNAGVNAQETIRSVGYGQNDKKMPIGTRLRKTGVSILATGKGVSRSKTALGVHEFEVGRSICQGDSGGPALSEDTGAVVGVVSRGGECSDDYGHVYTTTTGWSDLFDQAFAIAGGAPITESGQPVGPETGPRARPMTSPLAGQPSTKQGCAAAPSASAGGSGSLAIALASFVALVLKPRRARQSRSPSPSGSHSES
jgi:V8-like Glu-specific endopeptidase